jgi:hypothetical protein
VTLDDFRGLTTQPTPPADLTTLLLALWHDARDDWEAAHRLAQDVDTPDGAWVHAYLHRKEGDAANAGYWYRRARQPAANDSLDAEWERIARALLEKNR